MKYKTFRNITLAGAAVLCGGVAAAAYFAGGSKADPPPPTDLHVVETTPQPVVHPVLPPPPTTTTTATTATTTATTAATATTPAAPGLRPVDSDLLAAVRSAPVQAKIKDATRGRPYKVNLYSDDGSHWTRAKVDLDRDNKWDEKWTWKGDHWSRQVAPADDESYTETWALHADGWKKK